jgi:hypothetical protein
MTLSRGLYDLLLTEAVARALDNLTTGRAALHDVDAEELPERVADALGRQLRVALEQVDASDDEQARAQLALVNGMLARLREETGAGRAEVDPIVEPPKVLRAIHPAGQEAPVAPDTGLASPWLFTAGRGSPSLLNELRREAAACEQIDILVSFITVSGVRKLIDVLRSVTAGNAAGGTRWTCSSWRLSSTTRAMTTPAFRRCRGTILARWRRWTTWTPATTYELAW